MNIEQMNKRLELLDSVDFAGSASEEMILAAENKLENIFPPQYRTFLSIFGSMGVDSEEFFGLGGADHLNVVMRSLNIQNRKLFFSKKLIPIRGDGFGNYDCIDTAQPTENGEYAIIEWNHENTIPENNHVLARSYDEWFESILVMIETGD